jgi:2-dehydro-3-deoxygluconokinase
MNKRAVCFGEIMLRLNPKDHLRFVQASEFEASYAGGEANAAVSLACLGADSSFVSKVPEHEIGQSAVNALRRYGVDTSGVIRGGGRLGVYFVEKGASQRASKVIYDRAQSAIAEANPEEFDWDRLLVGSDWLHFTGITPALSDNAAKSCLNAVKAAKEKSIPVSCDLNYRKKLWSREKAEEVMGALMPYVDVCIANEEDAADVFGVVAENTDIAHGKLSNRGYVSVAERLAGRFSLKKVAITLRGSISASDNNWSAMLYEGGEARFSQSYSIHVVDRVGGGDSFSGALIYSQLAGWSNQNSINFAAAASCLKHSMNFDFNLISLAEVLSLAEGNASGRVQR